MLPRDMLNSGVCVYIYIYIYAIMKTMCPLGYHHHGFVATHALASCFCEIWALCVSWITYDRFIYIYIYILHIYILHIYILHIYIYIYVIYIYIVIHNELKVLVLPISFQFSNNYLWQWSPPTLPFQKVFDLLSYRKTTCTPIT